MPRKKTAEDYHKLDESRGFKWVGNVSPSSNKIKTLWECPQDHEWEAPYNRIQQGIGCPKCSGKYPKDANDYHKLAKRRGFKWLGIEVVNTQTKTLWECPQNHKWEAPYKEIQQGYGCMKCTGSYPKNSDDYHALAAKRGFKWIGAEVVNTGTKTLWQCSQKHKWGTTYNSIREGSGCAKCLGVHSKDAFEYHALAEKRGFKWIGAEVVSTNDKTLWQCSFTHKWEAPYYSIKGGSGCPGCNLSKGEEEVKKVLSHLNIKHQRQKKFDLCKGESGRLLPFDFYIPMLGNGILVEYQGIQHEHPVDFAGKGEEWAYEQFIEAQKRDKMKRQFALDSGFHLVEIWYFDFNHIEEILIAEIEAVTGKPFVHPKPKERQKPKPIQDGYVQAALFED